MFSNDDLLDLVGNRVDMLWLTEIMEQLKPSLKDDEFKLGHFIEYLKRKNLFPYKAIRVVDNSISPEKIKEVDRNYFIENKHKFFNIHPVFTICVLEKNDTLIQSFNHKFTSK